ncbi:MAG TPA: hypothetical protein VNG13_00180 [Mycobacteriales bacterium]|nr:hypothetical protein [Mycobacteriales bacterium]
MTADTLSRDELLSRVRQLRAGGRSPKEIAHALGLRPAVVAPVVRQVAAERAAPGEPGVAGCWVSTGWAAGLNIVGHADWPGLTDNRTAGSGLTGVLVARDRPAGMVSMDGYLVDVYCLGVKDGLGARLIPRADLAGAVRRFFASFDTPALPAPLELAQQLVFGAVDYARRLGFEPASEFRSAAELLGPWDSRCDIRFGENGKPYYVAGPYDDVNHIMRTLHERVGADNFHFIVPVMT